MADKILAPKTIKTLEKILGHSFADKALLLEAITHPSLEGEKSYQRLEFLGDRVLGVIIAGLIFERFKNESEGQLSRRFAALVRKETLASVAVALSLSPIIRMTDTTEKTGGRTNASIHSDVLEALIGALFVDGGYKKTRDFIATAWAGNLEDKTAAKDPKSDLQEWAQGRGQPLPLYETVEQTGPDHAPFFTVKVSVEGLGSASAKGPSKQSAETRAAEKLLGKAKSK
ncbi:MAG: ribonuclease III [Alphaproteobacteria bacterium]